MSRFLWKLLALPAAATVAWSAAPPAIRQEGVINAASLAPSQSPGGAIARGSIFRILGERLGPELPALNGVSVRVRSGDSVVEATPVYASASRIDAILPASTPEGEVSLTVTYKGLESAAVAVKVVDSSFGIFTQNGYGWGPAIGAQAAAPRATVTIRGTGLGAERKPEILVGGRRAGRIRYAGPSRNRAGEDEIRFELPTDAPQGCYVPVAVRSGGVESNTATIAITPKGQPCPPTAGWSDNGSLVLLWRASVQSSMFGNWTSDLMTATFAPQSGELAPLRMLPPPGACTAYGRTFTSEDIGGLIHARDLDYPDAGWIVISGPGGKRSVARWPRGPFSYWTVIGGGQPRRQKPPPLFLTPGTYTIAGPGGRQIGPFHTEATVPPAIEWTNRSQFDTIDRTQDLTVTWSGGGENELALVVAANADLLTGAIEVCGCVASATAGHLVVPARRMANLLAAGKGGAQQPGVLALVRIPARAQTNGPVTAVYVSLDARFVSFRR